MSQTNVDVPRLAEGDRLAGVWQVERVLETHDGVRAALARSASGGRALCFLPEADGQEPLLDEISATTWATTRKVMRDERHGRVVVDVVGAGEILADRLGAGGAVPPSVADSLAERVRSEHRRGRPHGQLKADRIVLGTEGPSAAGWGLVSGNSADLSARDLADLAALNGETGAVQTSGGRDASRSASLQAAISSEHLPTLRRAVQSAEAALAGEPGEDLLRARDALRRIEAKVEDCLVRARRMIGRNDPLGAVAACREAIRHGAEQQAEPMLRMARSRAKEMLDGPRRPGTLWVAGGAALFGVLALTAVLLWGGRGDAAQRELASAVERASAERGPREAVRLLLARHERGELEADGLALMGEQLALLERSERKRLVDLRREAIAQGARPAAADVAAEEALSDLEKLARQPEHPAFATQLRRALSRLDRAATIYRSRAELTAEQAMRAVERLIVEDPVFVERAAAGNGP